MTELAGKPVPKVSVAIITYNHEDFIADATEGALMQEIDFPTRSLLVRMEARTQRGRFSERMRSAIPRRSVSSCGPERMSSTSGGQPTGAYNLIESLNAAKGSYVALCEGDDYWIDPRKLQKQVPFLEVYA